MIGLIFIYWIGKAFYKLAEENDENKWLWAILGLVSFYISQILFAILAFMMVDFSEDINLEKGLNIVSVIVGGLCCWGFYNALKKRWGSSRNSLDSMMLDEDFIK